MSGLPNGHATPAAVLAEDATPGRNSDLERFVFLLGGALFSPARDNPGRWPGSAAAERNIAAVASTKLTASKAGGVAVIAPDSLSVLARKWHRMAGRPLTVKKRLTVSAVVRPDLAWGAHLRRPGRCTTRARSVPE
jgi:hypothetical protein